MLLHMRHKQAVASICCKHGSSITLVFVQLYTYMQCSSLPCVLFDPPTAHVPLHYSAVYSEPKRQVIKTSACHSCSCLLHCAGYTQGFTNHAQGCKKQRSCKFAQRSQANSSASCNRFGSRSQYGRASRPNTAAATAAGKACP